MRIVNGSPRDSFEGAVLGLLQFQKQIQEGRPQISPLRCAPVEMTKGRAALPLSVVAEQDPFFIALGGPKAHDSSGRDDKGGGRCFH